MRRYLFLPLLAFSTPALAQQAPLRIAPRPSEQLWTIAATPLPTQDTTSTPHSGFGTGAVVGAAIGAGSFLFLLNAGCGIGEDPGCVSGRSTLIAALSGGVFGLMIGAAFDD